jgi:hypothetical protein
MNIACTLVGVCEEVVVVGCLRLGAYEIRAAVHNSSNEELSAICLVEKMASLYLRQTTVQSNQKILTLMTIGSRGTTAEGELMAGTCSDSSSCEQIRTCKIRKWVCERENDSARFSSC